MITIIKRHGFGTARTHFTKIKRQSVNSISHLTLSELICVRNYIQNKHEDKKSEALTKNDKLYDGRRRSNAGSSSDDSKVQWSSDDDEANSDDDDEVP